MNMAATTGNKKKESQATWGQGALNCVCECVREVVPERSHQNQEVVTRQCLHCALQVRGCHSVTTRRIGLCERRDDGEAQVLALRAQIHYVVHQALERSTTTQQAGELRDDIEF